MSSINKKKTASLNMKTVKIKIKPPTQNTSSSNSILSSASDTTSINLGNDSEIIDESSEDVSV